jgi:hypothetical protein
MRSCQHADQSVIEFVGRLIHDRLLGNCTRCSIGSNSFSSLNFTPRAAKLAQLVNCFVVCMVDSFMMILLSQSSDST